MRHSFHWGGSKTPPSVNTVACSGLSLECFSADCNRKGWNSELRPEEWTASNPGTSLEVVSLVYWESWIACTNVFQSWKIKAIYPPAYRQHPSKFTMIKKLPKISRHWHMAHMLTSRTRDPTAVEVMLAAACKSGASHSWAREIRESLSNSQMLRCFAYLWIHIAIICDRNSVSKLQSPACAKRKVGCNGLR